jgi:transcriptional regulator with XRE-family HTH domain
MQQQETKPTMKKDPLGARSPQAVRLRRIRTHIAGDSQTEFAKRLGISLSRWNNIENGVPLGRDVAFRLVNAIPGLTLDYIYFGKPGGISYDLWVKLEQSSEAAAE